MNGVSIEQTFAIYAPPRSQFEISNKKRSNNNWRFCGRSSFIEHTHCTLFSSFFAITKLTKCLCLFYIFDRNCVFLWCDGKMRCALSLSLPQFSWVSIWKLREKHVLHVEGMLWIWNLLLNGAKGFGALKKYSHTYATIREMRNIIVVVVVVVVAVQQINTRWKKERRVNE